MTENGGDAEQSALHRVQDIPTETQRGRSRLELSEK